jgi:DNA-binding NarL/FixJ family response regulator
LGYEVLEPLATGQGAIEAAESESPDIILMDMGLAGEINGLDAAREIIVNYQLPVIIMTGHTDEKTLEEIEQINAVTCLTKPILGTDIHAAIQNYFQNRSKS